MFLYQIATYIPEAQTYYNNQSAAFGSFVTPYLSTLQSDYNSYVSGMTKTLMVQAIMGFSAYLTQKYGVIYPTNFPPIGSIFGDYLPNLFVATNYQLPDYTTLFSMTTNASGGVDYAPTETYTSLVTTITGALTTDTANIQNLGLTIYSTLLNVITYNAFTQDPQTQMNPDFNTYNYLMTNQQVDLILTVFNISILGLNWNL